MRPRTFLAALGLSLLVAACSGTEKEWMKVSERYTTEEFRRDFSACSKSGKLDETCMRGKGWVDVSPGRAEKPAPQPEVRQPSSAPPYRP